MMNGFFSMDKQYFERLRATPLRSAALFDFSDEVIDEAIKYLEKLYCGRVYRPFACKLLLLFKANSEHEKTGGGQDKAA